MDAERILMEEDEGWRRLHDVMRRIPADRADEAAVTPEGWSPKDVLFHLAAWLVEAGIQLERMRAGTFDPSEDPSGKRVQQMNEEWFEVGKRLDPATVRAELESGRVRMLMAWGALEDQSPKAWEWFEESGARHYDEHVEDLVGWLDGAST